MVGLNRKGRKAPAPRPRGRIDEIGRYAIGSLGERRARLYTPAGHDPSRPGYLLLMFDGQNVFGDEGSFAGGWHAHEAVEKLGKKRQKPLIVALDHGHHDRIRELSPWPVRGVQGELDTLLGFLCDRLLPEVRSRVSVVPGPVGALVAGSSMGGLAALYAHFKRPDVFGGALAMSPSLWLGEAKIFELVRSTGLPWTTRVYLDAGAREGMMLRLAESFKRELEQKGMGERLMFRADPKGRHSESDWRRRLPRALRFFYR